MSARRKGCALLHIRARFCRFLRKMCISACFIVAFLFRYLHVAVRVVRPFAEIVVRFLRLAEDVDDHFVLPGREAPLPDAEVQCREACPQVAFGP